MKRLLLTLVAIVGIAAAAAAQTPENVTLRAGQQRSTARSHLKIRFVAVTEDSRCPLGVNCIWAGNAKVKMQVTGRGGSRKIFEFNTTVGSKSEKFDGWAIELVSLTPLARTGVTIKPGNYVAKFTITHVSH